MTKPYTYLIKCIPTGEVYYGVRYANGCNPSEFWKTYFTSSVHVAKRLKLFGQDAFIFKIRKIFESKLAARTWEDKVLRRLKVTDNPLWLNRSYGMVFANRSVRSGIKQVYLYSEKTYKWFDKILAEVVVISGLGEYRGPPKPPGHSKNVSAALKGRKKSAEHILAGVKSRKANPRTQGYSVYTNGTNNIRVHQGDAIPEGVVKGSCIKGQSLPNKSAGKSYEQIYGKEKANQLRKTRSEHLRSKNPSGKMKGKTYDELYGVKKASILKENRSRIGKMNTKEYAVYHNSNMIYLGSRLGAARCVYERFGGAKTNSIYDQAWLKLHDIRIDTLYKNR